MEGRAIFQEDDALTYKSIHKADAGISCFLLEHLENPKKLLENLASSVKEGAPAFVTLALTAAEIDHIYEFKYESEAVLMAEKAGFRVIDMVSLSGNESSKNKYLPRSMAMILKRKKNDIW
jgi:hypothetical protein